MRSMATMRLAVSFALVCGAAFAQDPSAAKVVAVMAFEANPAAAAQAPAVESLVASHLAERRDVRVITRSDVNTLLGVERQRELLGDRADCDESSSCMTELAGAVGARYVMSGRVDRFGELYVITSSLFDANAAKVLVKARRDAANEAGIPAAARALAVDVLGGLPSEGGGIASTAVGGEATSQSSGAAAGARQAGAGAAPGTTGEVAGATGAASAGAGAAPGTTGAAPGTTGAAPGATGAASAGAGAAPGTTGEAAGTNSAASGSTGAASGPTGAASGTTGAASGATGAASGAGGSAITTGPSTSSQGDGAAAVGAASGPSSGTTGTTPAGAQAVPPASTVSAKDAAAAQRFSLGLRVGNTLLANLTAFNLSGDLEFGWRFEPEWIAFAQVGVALVTQEGDDLPSTFALVPSVLGVRKLYRVEHSLQPYWGLGLGVQLQLGEFAIFRRTGPLPAVIGLVGFQYMITPRFGLGLEGSVNLAQTVLGITQDALVSGFNLDLNGALTWRF